MLDETANITMNSCGAIRLLTGEELSVEGNAMGHTADYKGDKGDKGNGEDRGDEGNDGDKGNCFLVTFQFPFYRSAFRYRFGANCVNSFTKLFH